MARRALFALAGAGCAAFIIGAPLYYSWHDGEIGGFETAGVWAASATTIRVTSPVTLSTSPRLVLLQGTLHNQGRVQDVVRDAQGHARFVPKLQLDRPAFVLHTDGRGKTPAAQGPLQDLAQVVAALGFERLAIRDGTLTLQGATGRAVTMRGITAQFRGGRQQTNLAGKGSFILNGELISFDLATQVRQKRTGAKRLPIQISLKSKIFDARFLGQFAALDGLQLAGQINLKISNLRAFVRSFKIIFPYGPGLRDFSVNGQLSWQGDTLSFNKSTFVMDGNTASGALSLNVARPRPSIEGTLALKSLNLKRYIQPAQRKTKAEFLTRFLPKKYSSGLELLRYFDADLRISANTILVGGLATGPGAASISLKDGKLQADIAEIDLAAGIGMARGQFAIDMTGPVPEYVMRGKLADAKVRLLLREISGAKLLPDTATLIFDLTARGTVGKQIVSSMSGKASVLIKNDARIGVDLRPLLAASGKKGQPDWLGKLKGQMPIKRGAMKFVVHNGTVRTELLSCKGDDVSFSGLGTMDLATRLVDFNLAVWRKVPAATRAGRKEPPVVLNRAIRIHGPLHRPEIEVGDMVRAQSPVKPVPQPARPANPVLHGDRG